MLHLRVTLNKELGTVTVTVNKATLHLRYLSICNLGRKRIRCAFCFWLLWLKLILTPGSEYMLYIYCRTQFGDFDDFEYWYHHVGALLHNFFMSWCKFNLNQFSRQWNFKFQTEWSGAQTKKWITESKHTYITSNKVKLN